MYNCVVFDLDGTLVKSHETIYESTIDALKAVGINSINDRRKFKNLIGHHFKDIFDEFGFEVPDMENFINIYKNIYFDYISESELYEGAESTLSFLKDRNIKTALLTTKGQDQAEKIISHFGLSEYFDAIEGRKNGVPIKPDPDPLLNICSELSISPGSTLMVGDTEIDIQCGKNARTKTCAVSFGYRTMEVIEKEKPDYIINNLSEIKDIITNNYKGRHEQ